MDKQQKIEKINKILEKPIYKFHGLDEDNMIIHINVEATPQTEYYHRRETVDIINDLFEEEIEYTVISDENKIIIK